MHVAILGLGAMGSRMAQRLIDRGHRVVVFNRTTSKSRPLEAAGANVASSPREAARDAEIVISVVTDDAASRETWLDSESGALGSLKADAVAVESSTLSPAWVRALSQTMSEEGRAFVDAPVVGSRPQADAGQLIHLVGGKTEVFDRVRPVLEDLGSGAHHVGAAGAGATLKLVVNGLFGVQVAAVAELLASAERQGLDLHRAVDILGAMPTTSLAVRGVMGAILARRYEPMFPIDLVAKDFGYVLAEGVDGAALLPTSKAVHDVFERASREGLGGENIHAIAKLYATS